MTTTILTDGQIFDCFDRQCAEIVMNFDADELYPVGRAIEQAVLQSEQVQAWKKDAERYRSASKPESDGAVDICICRVNWETGTKEVLTGDRAHTAIDSAMEKQP